jgi:hypothetical protein
VFFVQTIYHVISVNELEELEIDTQLMDWTWNLADFFDHDEEEAAPNVIQERRILNNGVFDASKLFHDI